jgi:predicted ester cyclase
MKFTAESLIAEGDQVVARGRLTGTNTGKFDMVRMQHEATGRSVDVQAFHIYRISGGKIAEHWSALDHVAMQRQLGLVAKPA